VSRARTEDLLARRVDAAGSTRAPDAVLVEEPLEIRLDDTLVATTMRTPGHDFELAVGWCHGEGVLVDADGDPVPVTGIRYCATGSAVETAFNTVTVGTGGRAAPPTPRLQTTTSACGICGADTVDALTARLEPVASSAAGTLDAAVLAGLGDRVGPHQELFALTGGSHAAAACTRDGDVLVVREDIGRHNAVDKVVGRLVLDAVAPPARTAPAAGLVLWVSGRASFEMVQKAWAAGFSALVSVSAPSSLAVATARRAGLVLVGFARAGRATIYAGDDHVVVGTAGSSVAERPGG
jgi:FdhD protein